MSKNEILYVKGMNVDDTADDDDDDMWDDTQLNNAYDRALQMASVEVAKRVAMSTNSNPAAQGENKKNPKQKKNKPAKQKWASGMPCRAVFEGDGLEYEAFVLRVINDKECVVRFLGYENSEIVSIEKMKPSLGKEAQQRQIEESFLDKDDGLLDGAVGNQTHTLASEQSDAGSDRTYCSRNLTGVSGTSSPKRNKSRKKKGHHTTSTINGFNFPGSFPMPLPNIRNMRGLSSMEVPMPPPPLSFPSLGLDSDRSDSEEQAVSSMLLSWYMSGYYTGLYQGLKRSKENQKNQSNKKNS